LSSGPGLPPGVLDATSGIRSQGDVFVPLAPPAATDPALVTPAVQVPYGQVLAVAAQAADRAGWAPGVRLLTGAAPERMLAEVVGPLVRLGSVVLHHDLASLDEAAVTRLCAQEGVTAVSPG